MRILASSSLILVTALAGAAFGQEPDEEEGRPEWIGAQLSHHVSLADSLKVAHTPNRTSRESISDWGSRSTQLYRIWVRPAPLFSVRFFWSRTVYRDDQVHEGPDDRFGALTLSAGDRVEAKLELEVADLDFVFHPLALTSKDGLPAFDLEAGIGLRRVRWATSVEVGDERESDHVRVVMPTLLLGLTARPLKGVPLLEGLALFVRGRLGASAATESSADGLGDGDESKWSSVSGELEVGASYTLAGIVGVTVGYRLEGFKIRRTKVPDVDLANIDIPGRVKQLEGTAHGPFIGLILQY